MAEDGATDRETVLLTYRELGERTGRSRDAARQLARSRGWRTVPGNDGSHRVVVPRESLREEAARGPRGGREQDVDHLASVREDAAEAREEAAVARARLEAEREAHAREIAAIRELVDELRRQLDRERRPWWRRLVGG